MNKRAAVADEWVRLSSGYANGDQKLCCANGSAPTTRKERTQLLELLLILLNL